MNRVDLARARDELMVNVRDGILPFWRDRAADEVGGGYITEFDGDGQPIDPVQEKSIVPQAGLVWCFSSCAALAPDRDAVLDLARHGVDFLVEAFHDGQHGGWYWRVTRDGSPADTTKHLYAQVFASYALATFARATGDDRARALVDETLDLVERNTRDRRHGGYFEHFDHSWQRDGRDAGGRKTAAVHAHLLEALVEAAVLTDDAAYRTRSVDLAALIRARMVDEQTGSVGEQYSARFEPLEPIELFRRASAASAGQRFKRRARAFVTRASDTGGASDGVSYGHALEVAWLLGAADRAAGTAGASDPTIAAVAAHVLEHGYDRVNGGVFLHGSWRGDVSEREKAAWANAEAMIGFLEAARVTDDEAYLDAFLGTWQFARTSLSHPALGEWRRCVTDDGEIVDGRLASEQTNPYHTTRAALESVKRLDALIGSNS